MICDFLYEDSEDEAKKLVGNKSKHKVSGEEESED